MISKAFYDGLGRTYRSARIVGLYDLWEVSVTEFDALGRAWRTMTPFHTTDVAAGLPASPEWTTSTFDALGRVTQVETPDTAKVLTSYIGNEVTVTDQAGKQRKSVTDALGRLTEVIEDPNGLHYSTTYLYDSLDNLHKVTQGSQTRWFGYDSLSRLIRVKNPETDVNPALPPYTDPLTGGSGWSMAYTYDPNGNLATRTDARNITATYTYDALNRPTYLSYSSYPDGTADKSWVYDYPTVPYGKGRLSWSVSGNARWHLSGAIDGKPYWDVNVIHAYDALGRPAIRWQGFALSDAQNNYTGWQSYVMHRNYN
jgi:YD repeat-containing protein